MNNIALKKQDCGCFDYRKTDYTSLVITVFLADFLAFKCFFLLAKKTNHAELIKLCTICQLMQKIMHTYNHRIIPLSLNETALQVCLLNLVFLLFLSNEISECAIKFMPHLVAFAHFSMYVFVFSGQYLIYRFVVLDICYAPYILTMCQISVCDASQYYHGLPYSIWQTIL